MNTCFKFLSFFFVAIIAYLPVKATHLIGADISYVCVGNNEYEIILNVYRDCGPNNTAGTGFDTDATIRLYNTSTDTFDLFTSIFDGVITDVNQEITDPCIFIPEELCIERATYRFDILIPDTTQSYFVNYQRCCFGGNVGNIDNSAAMGINISALIPPSSFESCYSSPTFNNLPLLTMCLNEPLSEDFGAMSSLNMPGNLEYSLFTPYAGASSGAPLNYTDIPFIPMLWSSGYSATYPIESNPALGYNGLTGGVTGTVTELGYFIIGTRVEVLDNSNDVVGSIERVFKYTVTDCSAGEHLVEIESELGANVQICQDDIFTFEVGANATTDSLFWTVNGDTVHEGPTLQYAFDEDGAYDVTLHGIADSVECFSDGSFSQNVRVFSVDVGFKARTLICAGEVNTFVDTTFFPADITYEIVEWLWTFGDGQSSSSETPQHTYDHPGFYDVSLTVTLNNGCVETISIEDYIEVYDVDLELESVKEICVNNVVPFTSMLTLPDGVINPIVSYQWDFGDGETSDEANPEHEYTTVGEYDVSLGIELQTGCTYYISYQNHISIFDDYIDVDIDVLTDTMDYPFTEALYIKTTTNNFDSISWTLNDVHISSDNDLQYNIGEGYNEEYLNILVEFFEGSCTTSKEVFIPATYTNHLFLPNAFTPNGDDLNNVFKPKGRIVDHAVFYKFVIYNRYGQQYFNSSDKNEAWEGYNMDGVEVDQGLYVWTLDIVTQHSGSYSEKGVVMLMK